MTDQRGTYGPLSRATWTSLKRLNDDPSTAATRALCRHYANLIDAAAIPDALVDALDILERAALVADAQAESGATAIRAFRRVAAMVSQVSVASDLGPKLLTALNALGLSSGGPGPGGDTRDRDPASVVAQLRGNARRQRRAAPVDSAAP